MRPTANIPAPGMPPGGERIAPYAWIVLSASFLTTALVFGVWFSYAVFFATMVEEFQWSRGGTAVPFSIGNLVQAALSPLIGLLTDRWGARQVIVWGCICCAAGLAACSMVQSLWHLTLFFGVGVGLGVGLAGPVAHSALLATWFVRRRGTLIGLAFAGMGVGVKIVGPLAQHLILQMGWRHSFLALALFTLGYALLMALTLRNSPHDVGLQPYGASTRHLAPSPTGSAAAPPAQAWTVRRATRTREFWALMAVQMFIPLGIFPIAVHQVAYLVDLGFSKILAAGVLGYMGLMSSCGRILFGSLSDRLGRFGGVMVSIACSQLGIVVLLLMQDASVVWPLYLYALFFGLGYGARGPIISAIAADLFAGKQFGTIFGLISIGHGIGGALGPWMGGMVYDHFGHYTLAFVFSLLALCGVAAGFWLATRRLTSAARTLPRH
jgi:MFS family permease